MADQSNDKLLIIFPGHISNLEEKGNAEMISNHNPDDLFSEVHVLQPPSTSTEGRDRFRSFVFHYTRIPSVSGPLLKVLRAIGWVIVFLKALWIVKREHIDIVRAQSPFEPAVVGVAVQVVLDVSTIVSLHNDYDTRQNLEGNYDILGQRWLTEAVERFTISRAHHVFVLTRFLKYYAIQHGADENQTYILPHKVRKSNFETTEQDRETTLSELGVDPDRLVFVFVGRLVEQKDPQTLIEGYQLARTTVPESELLIVGDGRLREPLEQAVEENGIENVTFTGFVDRSSVFKILQSSDVFVFPTLCEGFGFVFIEALASKLPIVTTDIPHTKDIVSGDHARLFEPRDSKALSEHLVALADETEREEMGTASLRAAESYYTETRDEAEANLFRELIDSDIPTTS